MLNTNNSTSAETPQAAIVRAADRTRTVRSIIAALALALVFGGTLAPGAAQASEEAERFVETVVDRSFEILNSASFSDVVRSKNFCEFMSASTDIRRIGTFTLGPYVNRSDPAEIVAFIEAFKEYTAAIYEAQLATFRGHTVVVAGSTDRAPDDSIVSVQISNPNASGAPIIRAAFRVRANEFGEPIITDIQLEGIWLAINQRADFTSFLSRNGGSVAALTEFLNRQALEVRQVQSAGRGTS